MSTAYLDYEVRDITDAEWAALMSGLDAANMAVSFSDQLRAAREADEQASAVLMQDVVGMETSPGKTHSAGWFVHVMDR